MKDNSTIKILTPVNIVGFILVMMAGWIDTAGLELFLNERVSFMTGRAAELGESIARGDIREFSFVIIIVVIFIIGATISAKITRKWGLIGGLTFSGMLLIIAALCIYEGDMYFVEIAIPMAMGGQNAATSLTPINRTTHLTGPATDIGVYLSSGDWNGIIFWLLRWIAFPMGAFIGFKFIGKSTTHHHVDRLLVLIIPAIIIILTGIIQKITVDIPLLEDEIKYDEEEFVMEKFPNGNLHHN
ncbi:hypothetical protein GCM10008905_24590 [Clostridium malenominatum]|uniref:DUF1275 domain-containing protein n=1 Tax=Clostridium malenominatum TaxID=1539 RepID=A0ABP3U8Q7_9CLOT